MDFAAVAAAAALISTHAVLADRRSGCPARWRPQVENGSCLWYRYKPDRAGAGPGEPAGTYPKPRQPPATCSEHADEIRNRRRYRATIPSLLALDVRAVLADQL